MTRPGDSGVGMGGFSHGLPARDALPEAGRAVPFAVMTEGLAAIRRKAALRRHQRGMDLRVDRLVPALRRSGPFTEGRLADPCARRPDGSWHEAAAAIRADVRQHVVHAVRAERALEGT